jgi:hypothetical protein
VKHLDHMNAPLVSHCGTINTDLSQSSAAVLVGPLHAEPPRLAAGRAACCAARPQVQPAAGLSAHLAILGPVLTLVLGGEVGGAGGVEVAAVGACGAARRTELSSRAAMQRRLRLLMHILHLALRNQSLGWCRRSPGRRSQRSSSTCRHCSSGIVWARRGSRPPGWVAAGTAGFASRHCCGLPRVCESPVGPALAAVGPGWAAGGRVVIAGHCGHMWQRIRA